MKFFQIKRASGTAVAVWVDNNGKAHKQTFSVKKTDAQIKREIMGVEAPETDTVETADNGEVQQTSASVSAAPDTDNKAVLRAHYIEFLKGKGVDMSTERSFRRLEEVYKEHGGK